jgi:hypothetical protein
VKTVGAQAKQTALFIQPIHALMVGVIRSIQPGIVCDWDRLVLLVILLRQYSIHILIGIQVNIVVVSCAM